MEGSFDYFDQVEVASPGRGDLIPDGRPISILAHTRMEDPLEVYMMPACLLN